MESRDELGVGSGHGLGGTPVEPDPRDRERLGVVDAFLGGGQIQGAHSALGAALSPNFPKFFPQYPNENEQQKGK